MILNVVIILHAMYRQHQSDLALSGEELLIDIASYSPGIAGIDASTPTEDMPGCLRECYVFMGSKPHCPTFILRYFGSM